MGKRPAPTKASFASASSRDQPCIGRQYHRSSVLKRRPLALGYHHATKGAIMRNHLRPTLAFAALGAAFLACEHDDGRASTPTGNGADDQAVSQIAATRCDQQASCNNIGAGRRYATRDACKAQFERTTRRRLNPETCAAGVDLTRVDACLAEIKKESCDPVDTEQMDACRKSALCIRQEAPVVTEIGADASSPTADDASLPTGETSTL
jgi:hypothetical protein